MAGLIYCYGCGKQVHESALACPHCGAPQRPITSAANATVTPTMTQAQSLDPLPPGIKGWSWGAFLLNWIWAIGNRTWIGLLALIPYIGVVMAIVLGIKGREWAWKNKSWESVEQFNAVQRKWSIWGFIIIGAVLVIALLVGIGYAVYEDSQNQHHENTDASLLYQDISTLDANYGGNL